MERHQTPRLRAVLQTAASGHDCNPRLIFVSHESADSMSGRTEEGSTAVVDASGDCTSKPLYPPAAPRLCGRGLEICAGSGQRRVKQRWAVPWSCPIEVRHSVRARQPPITASLNQFQAPRKSRPFELLRGRGRGSGWASGLGASSIVTQRGCDRQQQEPISISAPSARAPAPPGRGRYWWRARGYSK